MQLAKHSFSLLACSWSSTSPSSCLHQSYKATHPCLQLVKLNARFQRVVVTRDEALAMFQENRFKVEIISGLPQDAVISLYRCTA